MFQFFPLPLTTTFEPSKVFFIFRALKRTLCSLTLLYRFYRHA